jgi:2-oxoglutarate dehydrogenase E1 component
MATQPSSNSFLFGGNATFIAEMFARYIVDPSSVDESWQGFFAGLDDDARGVLGELKGASWARSRSKIIGAEDPAAATAAKGKGGKPAPANDAKTEVSTEAARQAAMDTARALMLIRAFRSRGHLAATLDPLQLEARKAHTELEPEFFGFTAADLDRPIFVNGALGFETATVKEIVARARAIYSRTIGVEYMHIQDTEQRAWIQKRIEGEQENTTDFTLRGKKAIYNRLIAAEGLERFLDKKYTGTKRFGLDGGESLIPAIEQVLKRGSQLGLREVVLGMPHRGRLNILTNVMLKPFKALFSEFQGNSASPDDVEGSGDVKYHLGTSADREFDGQFVHLSLTANPSHLEAVDPVVLGKVRAKQNQKNDTDRTQVMAMLFHGDAAFAGQGLVPETLALAELRGYRTGGTVHFIVNNQIGFTTAPSYSRFTPYPTDWAKGVQAPIFHVNGDDPESVVHVTRIATEFRMQFKRDVVIDIVCYRRHGHNEGDEPAFTQPLMYKKIATHPTTRQIYEDRLIQEGHLTREGAEQEVNAFFEDLEREFEASKSYKPNKADWLEGSWSGLKRAPEDDRRGSTGLDPSILRDVGYKLTEYPEGFNINRKIQRQLEAKRQMIETGKGLDWATAEALAFGTLLVEGVPVRLSGQDSGRGTFSQRHSVFIDQENENRFEPLNNIRPGQARYEVIDSPLAELSVLGFDYGYSLADPHALVLWEGQFGDFVNGAQVIIDQFIASGESKWLRMSGLVMLLPHGYEGQGPEHSSARPERFLQLCAEDNMQVVNITTPANYFHALRRQIRRDFRKPLIVMAPKSLLRHKAAVSDFEDFVPSETFHRVLRDRSSSVAGSDVKRVVLCTGKVYYDLAAEAEKRGLKDIAISRIEQLYPFPHKPLTEELSKFPNAEVVWCQEEPMNQGAWHFLDRRIESALIAMGHKSKRPVYVGRPDAAAPATGLLKRHNQEQAALVDAALTL